MLKKLVNKIKKWSGWDKAGTIVKARLEAVVGFLAAAAAGLLAFDWLPYLSTGEINWKSVAMIGVYLLVSGIVTEIVRRRGATDL